jgi:hypothetical protein
LDLSQWQFDSRWNNPHGSMHGSVVAFQYIGDSNACDVFPSRCLCEYDRELLLGFPLQLLLFSLKKYEGKLIMDFQ